VGMENGRGQTCFSVDRQNLCSKCTDSDDSLQSASLQLFGRIQYRSSSDGSRGTLWPAADANWRPEMTCTFLGPDSYVLSRLVLVV